MRDNIHSMAQILVLADRVNKNAEAAKSADCLFGRMSPECWPQLHLSKHQKNLQGVAVYYDVEGSRFCYAATIHGKDKSFAQQY